MEEINSIRKDLKKQSISPRVVLGNCCLVNEQDKDSPAFCDNNNLPFYYYLGKYLPKDSLLNIGFGLGLPLIFYMLSYKPKRVIAYHDPGNQFYSSRLGINNIA